MPQRTLVIPGVERLDLPETRRSIEPLHAYVRQCILDGRIPPGAKLSQAALAEQLGVSRTPVREVLRMLQEEGLVEFEPNQRMRVTGFDPDEVDAAYGARIALECLAVAMTAREFGPPRQRAAAALLVAMREAAHCRDLASWSLAHEEFHHTLTAAAGEPMRGQMRSLADCSARWIRSDANADPGDWQEVGERDHAALVEAMAAGDERHAVSLMAHHLERTARLVLAERAPDFALRVVPRAVALVVTPPQPAHVARPVSFLESAAACID
jgi:DNA-binding GntR family transcriptional regulator